MPMERLPHKGWVDVPNCKRVYGPLTLTKEQWSTLEKWALDLQKEATNQNIRPKEREKAHYVLTRVAMLFRAMGFTAATGTLGLRVFEPMTDEEMAEMRNRLDTDDDFVEEIRRGWEYWSQY